MIKIAPPTLTIDKSFKDAVLGIYRGYLENIDMRSGTNVERRRKLLGDNPEVSRRALDAVQGVVEARRGLQYEWTRFTVADEYVRLYAIEYRRKTWLIGETKPITISGPNRRTNKLQSWQIGSYSVAYSATDLIQGVDKHHFIPLAEPATLWRTPHHSAYSTTEYEISKNPLDMLGSTCWGGFGTGVSYSVTERDVPALFSMIFKYISRYDAHSVLNRYVENNPWMIAENLRRSKLTSA